MMGLYLIIVTHKEGTFDHQRKVTPLEHIVEDFEQNIGEDDLTHLEEILKYHDLKRDPAAGTLEQFSQRSIENFTFRGLHHHVFNSLAACLLVDQAGFKVLNIEEKLPFHIIITAQKSSHPDNKLIIDKLRKKEFNSPFESD